jgi:hypothetical protein
MYMADPINGSGLPGSPIVPAPIANQAAPAGQTNTAGGVVDNSKAYDELSSRFGAQGTELGEYRTFFQNIAPLLDKLDQAPEMVQAIIDGRLTKDVAKAVLEGRVDVRDAAAVTVAHEAVKEKLGETAYDAAAPEAITKLVEAQVNKFRREIEEKSELTNFQNYTQEFIQKTPDFAEYADAVDKWIDTHDVTDIEVAYYAVKGQMSESAAKKAAEIAAGDRAKDLLSNASGGGQSAQYASDGTPLIDRLIAGRPNPNSFFPGA